MTSGTVTGEKIQVTSTQKDAGFLRTTQRRNVLIYFSVEKKKEILQRVRRVMRLDGCLFLGSAETTLNLDDSFERVPDKICSYYRLRR